MNNEINYVSPFKKFCITIGNLPTAYLESMSYYEGLTYLVNYLSNNVIPALNNNGLVVEELQAKFVELKNFVDTYFDNLDVQEEVNNKLDEMAESGELTDIIAQYLGLAGLLVFNSVSDLKLAENLANGSSVKTLGYYSYSSGGGALYKVRPIVNTDVVDDRSIISLYDNNLVAELISNVEVNVKQFGAVGDGTTDDTNSIQAAIDYCIENNLNLLINSTSQFYKITKPLKLICERSSIGYWAGTGLIFKGENKGDCRIVKIGTYVFTEETITEINNKNAVIISVTKPDLESGTGISIKNLTLENYADSEFNIDNSSYGLYTNVSRSTYKDINIKAYKGIKAECFSCLFENLYFICTENAFTLDNGTSNTFRFMYTNGCADPYKIGSFYSTLLSVCGDNCTGTMYKLSGLGLSLINCGCESPNVLHVFEPTSAMTNVYIDNFYMHRQIGTDNSETDLSNSSIVYAAYSSNFTINSISLLENKELSGTSYVFNTANADIYLNSTLNNIKYNKNFTGTNNQKLKLWKNSPTGYSPQCIRTNTLDFNYFVTGSYKLYPYIGGYIDTTHGGVNNINGDDISKTKSIWLDCKDQYHNESGDDIRYTGYHNVGDIQLYNDPKGRNAVGLVVTNVTSRDNWETKKIPMVLSGSTANRPTTNLYAGLQYFDNTLNIPIWYNGAGWVNSTGNDV